MAQPINQSDFLELGILAPHCDTAKLNIAIKEALDFDLCSIFGPFGVQMKLILTEVLTHSKPSHGGFTHYGTETDPTEYWNKLILGNVFTQDGKPVENLGVKRGVIYYAYSRYLMISSFNDSATGMVSKENSFSIPKPLKEVEQIANKYRNMGRACFVSSISYICSERENFPELKDLDCSEFGCGCSSKGSCESNRTKGYGFRGQNIEKA